MSLKIKQLWMLGLLHFLMGSCLQAADLTLSGSRSALLLGNSTYDGFKLNGVDQSLDEVQTALKSHGFRVVRGENLTQRDAKAAIEQFVQSVPTNGVALIYYIGLGAHVDRLGKSYNLLRPVGEKIQSDNDYRSRGLNVLDLIKSLREQSGSRVNLVFLDACWQSPIKPEKGQVAGGMQQFEVDSDTTVMFAAGSGQTISAPKDNVVSSLAAALARHVGQLDGSVKQCCEVMSADLGQAWFGGATELGIGERSTLPVIDGLTEGKQPGDGFVNSIGMGFRWCPPGTFRMGSDQTGTSATLDRKPVQVTLSKGAWMGEHEVTQREYSVVMRKNVPLGFTKHKNAPFWGATEAKSVTQFCDKLTELERKAGTLPNGWEYKCPTEAEWEYACRAGAKTAYCYGDSTAELGRFANFADNALWRANPNFYWAERNADDGVAEALAPVGSYRPNAWGLRDMHGNVAEIVADHLLPELPGGTDPLGRVEKGGNTQIRGGAWCSQALYCESSFRNAAPGRDKHNFVGFRVVLKKVN